MNIDWIIAAPIISPIITLFIAAILNHILARRPQLIAYYGHVAAFTSGSGTENQVQLHTHEVVVRNVGRRPAKNVRLGHTVLPQFQVNPAVAYSVEDLPGGAQEILFPLLVPGEQITVSYLYYPPIVYTQINTNLRSDEGFGKVVNVLLTIQYPTWFTYTLLMLIALGLGSLLYLIIILMIWLF